MDYNRYIPFQQNWQHSHYRQYLEYYILSQHVSRLFRNNRQGITITANRVVFANPLITVVKTDYHPKLIDYKYLN